jgi:hypothetical protein
MHSHLETNGNWAPGFSARERRSLRSTAFFFRWQGRVGRAGIELVRDAVGIVVHLRAAVSVFKTIDLLPTSGASRSSGRASLSVSFCTRCEAEAKGGSERRVADTIMSAISTPARRRIADAESTAGLRSSQRAACSRRGARVERRSHGLRQRCPDVVGSCRVFQVQRPGRGRRGARGRTENCSRSSALGEYEPVWTQRRRRSVDRSAGFSSAGMRVRLETLPSPRKRFVAERKVSRSSTAAQPRTLPLEVSVSGWSPSCARLGRLRPRRDSLSPTSASVVVAAGSCRPAPSGSAGRRRG